MKTFILTVIISASSPNGITSPDTVEVKIQHPGMTFIDCQTGAQNYKTADTDKLMYALDMEKAAVTISTTCTEAP